MKKFLAISMIVAAGAAAANADLVLFDNYSNQAAGGHLTGTSSTPNTFMGSAYNLIAGSSSITGFDLFPVNFTTTTFNALKLTVYIWGGVNTGTIDATHPAFSSLLNSYTLTTTGTFTGGFYFPFVGAQDGITPGITLGVPLAIPSTTIGMTFNYQGSTNGGLTYANVNALTSIISHTDANSWGSNVFNGYYRNAASETNGNFVSTLRSLGLTNQSIATRLFGVPTPGALSLIGLGGLVVGRRRR